MIAGWILDYKLQLSVYTLFSLTSLPLASPAEARVTMSQSQYAQNITIIANLVS